MEQIPLSVEQFKELTYPGPNLTDHTLDDNDLARYCPLDNGRHQTTPRFTLGMLDRLPLELMSAVLVQIDLRSLTDFRRVNQRAMEVVDSIPQYKAIVTHALASLRGILSIETGLWILCQKLYDKLCTAECERCGDFAGFLYIITCKRVCFLCLSEEQDFCPLLRADAIRKFGLDHRLIASLPQTKSIPGIYSPNAKISRTRLTLIDHESARRAGIALHGSASAMEQYVSDLASKKLGKYRERIAQKASGALGLTPRRPRSGDAWDGQSSNPRRFMAVVRAPWLDLRTRSIEWAFHCIGCHKGKDRPMHWRRKFMADTLDDHIKQCGDIIDKTHRPT